MSDNTPQPVLVMNSVLAGLGILLGGAALLDYVDPKLVGLLILVHAALTFGWGTYVRGRVYPQEKVAAAVERQDGRLVTVAGPAAVVKTGQPVDVTRTDDHGWGIPPTTGGTSVP